MEFVWQTDNAKEWHQHLQEAAFPNLLQTWPYAKAMRFERQMMTRFAQVVEDGKTLALFTVQEIKLAGLIHVLHCYRGPVWIEGCETHENWDAFLKLFAATFPARFGRMRRFLPELVDTEENRNLLASHGFKRFSDGYETLNLDLSQAEEDLRKNLKPNWRHSLNRSEREGLSLEVSSDDAVIHWFLSHYEDDKTAKNYAGAKPKFLERLIVESRDVAECLIIRVLKDGEPVSGKVLFIHGNAAVDQATWTGDLGRKSRAHHFLLWNAILLLKERGIARFDLGGINPDTAEGVTIFKEGLRASRYKTVGLYR